MKKPEDTAENVFWLLAASGFFISLCITGLEFFMWLKYGHWPDNTLAVWLNWFNVDLSNIYYPSNWIGIAKIIKWFLSWPISVFLPVFIIFIAWIIKFTIIESNRPYE
jgi:hypothetical protein